MEMGVVPGGGAIMLHLLGFQKEIKAKLRSSEFGGDDEVSGLARSQALKSWTWV
jgi:TctA family transporter